MCPDPTSAWLWVPPPLGLSFPICQIRGQVECPLNVLLAGKPEDPVSSVKHPSPRGERVLGAEWRDFGGAGHCHTGRLEPAGHGPPRPQQAEDRTTGSSGLLGRVPPGHLGPGVPLRLRSGLPRSKGLDGFHWGPRDTLACSALLQKCTKDVGSRNKTTITTTAKVEAVDNDCYACLISVPSPHDRAKW